jgi:isorenieratene synthase
VKLPLPAMLMEAAATSALLAANAILRADGAREVQVWSVPPRGILAGVKNPLAARRSYAA